MSIWHWNRIPSSPPPEHQVTLGEGQTPVVIAKNVVPAAGGRQLWLKLETSNPTGSYKDRFAASAISHMQAAGQSRCLATSSGNTGSALAAYCAATKTACKIAIVESAPAGKLMQMQAYGAQLFR